MSDYYIEQKFFSFPPKFNVMNSDGTSVFNVRGQLIAAGKTLFVNDMDGNHLVKIHHKIPALRPTYSITELSSGRTVSLKKKFTLLEQKYLVDGTDWTVKGEITDHSYTITDSKGNRIGEINKEFFTFTDCFHISAEASTDDLIVLGITIAIDAVLDAQERFEDVD